MAETSTEGLPKIFRPGEQGLAQALAQLQQRLPIFGKRFVEFAPRQVSPLSALQQEAGKLLPDLYKLTPSQRTAMALGKSTGVAGKVALGAGGVTGAEQGALSTLGAGLANIRRQQTGALAPPATVLPSPSAAEESPFQAGLTASLARTRPQQFFGQQAHIPTLREPARPVSSYAQGFKEFTQDPRRKIISDARFSNLKTAAEAGVQPVHTPDPAFNITTRGRITDRQLADVFQRAVDKDRFVMPSDFTEYRGAPLPSYLKFAGATPPGPTAKPSGKPFLSIEQLIQKDILKRNKHGDLRLANPTRLGEKIVDQKIDPALIPFLTAMQWSAGAQKQAGAPLDTPLSAGPDQPGQGPADTSPGGVISEPFAPSPKGFLTVPELIQRDILKIDNYGQLSIVNLDKLNAKLEKGRVSPTDQRFIVDHISRLV